MPESPPRPSIDPTPLAHMVRTDQLAMVRRSVLAAIPINLVLSLAAALVALGADRALEGAAWLALSVAVNLARHLVCRRALSPPAAAADGGSTAAAAADARQVERRLRSLIVAAAASGGVWALIPLLCDGYTSPQTLFYLTVVCGICAGSVIYGVAYAWVPIAFITPVLLSASACLAHAGGFDHLSLAAMVLLYLAALVRAAVQSERSFRVGSRLKNEATSMAARLRQTHQSLQESTKRLAHRASHDALTGLLNREGFTQAAARHGSPRRETTHGVLLLDLDGFKGVNDAFGHQAGDQLLSDVGGWLRRQLHGREGLVGRWGGDEFVVLHSHPRRGHREAAVALAESLIASLPRALGRHASHVGVSIGIAVAQGSDVVEMINLADEALYEAKRAGRNRYRLVDEALHLRLAVRRDVERDLVEAIRTRSLQLWFQPIVTCAERGIHSLEALLRWDHPVHGRIPPEQLIFAAASTGRAEALLRYIVEETCTALHALNDSGSALAWAPVAINVSPREMTQLAVDELVLGMLAERGVAPHRLKIEITEELALDTQAARTRLNTLSAAGVTIVVDDFGVGYSSLASLRDNYVSQVKVDRSFVSGLKASPGNQVLVSAIVQLGRSLNIEVVAEGVETADDLQVLRSLGCGLAQGYHFARPAPLADLVEWARRHEAASAPVR